MSLRAPFGRRLARKSAIILAAASAAGGLTQAVWGLSNTFTYTAGGTSWTNPSAWLFGNPFPGQFPGEVASFTTVDLAPIGPTIYPITVDTNLILGQLNFTDSNTATPGAWQLLRGGSSTITLNTGNANTQPILNVGNMGNSATYSYVEIAVPLYGTSGFIKQGGGRLILSGDNGVSGSISIQGGTLEVSSVNNLGTQTDAGIIMAGGTLSLRTNGAVDLSGRNLIVTANSGLDVNRSVTSSASSIIDTIGTVTMSTGPRSLTITGGNLFGVNVGTLVLDTGNTAAVINQLAPGQLTIGNVITPALSAASTLSFGGTNTTTTGNNLVITNSIAQNSTAPLSVVYSDAHTMTVGSFTSVTGNLIVSGNGTLILNIGMLPTGSLGVSNGTLDFSATNQVSTVAHLQMGGGTASYITTGSSTTSGLQVSGNITFSASTGGLGGTVEGKLLLGSGSHSIQVNGISGIPTQELTVNAVTSGSGLLSKGGSGEILLTAANALTGTLVINQGTFSGAARATGDALTTGAVTISGGALRLVNQTATPGSAAIGSLDFNGAATNPAFLVIDSGASNATTTLNVGNFLGRVGTSSGALLIIPKNGGLGTTERLTAATVAGAISPGTNHLIFAPYIAAQVSSSDSSIDFLASGVGTQIVGGSASAAYTTGDINSAGANSVYATTTGQNLTGDKQMFALKGDGTAAVINGASNITLGDGNLAGLILNKGAVVNAANLIINANEAIFWAGGRTFDLDGTTVLSAGGTIGSNVSFATTGGALTTSGSQTLTFAGSLDLGNQVRTITVSNGTAVFNGAISNGSMIKSGPSYLIMNNANPLLSGTLTAASGTLQIGQGSTTPSAGLGTASVNIGNGNVVINLNGTQTLNNYITSSGTGALVVDSPTGIIRLTNPLSNYTSLTVQNGEMQLTASNQIPSGATLTVQNSGSFDMNGFSQTVGSLAGTTGTGVVTNGNSGVSTLNLNVTNTLSPTYSGLILGGVGGIAVNKLGNGTQILSGSSNFAGGTRILAGVLQASNNGALGTGSIQMLGGALALSNGVNLSNQVSIGGSTGTVTVTPGSNTGTLSGPISVNGGTLAVVFGGANGTLSANAAALSNANFNGTVAFFSTGSGTGTFRLPQATNAPSTTFNFGTATGTVLLNNIATFGTILGTGASTITGGSLVVGSAGGTSSFGGVIGSVLNKVGNGTFIISSTTVRNHPTSTINTRGGALVFGQNARLTGNVTVNIGTFATNPTLGILGIDGTGGDLYFTGDANFTNNATINLSNLGKWDVSGVPGGYAGAPSLTVSGSGNVLGAYSHASGTFSPGGGSRTGTITFNSLANPGALTMGNGFVNLDFTNPGITNVGGGTNDLIVVNGDVNFSPNTFYRFNYIGTGSVNAGDDYPLMYYTGNKTNWGPSAVSLTAGKVRSAFRADMVLKEISPGVIAAHVNSIGGQAQTLVWSGTASNIWDLNLTANFKNSVGAGTNFFQLDTVIFDDSAVAHPTALLENAVFLPAQVIVNNGSNVAGVITIGANGNPSNTQGVGTLSGSMQLIKRGTGQLNLNSYNTFTGGIQLESGTLNINNGTWVERDFDHPQAGGGGFGSIVFTSTTGAATLVNSGNANISISSNIHIPAGVTANLANSTGINNYLLAPITGSGTLALYGPTSWAFRTGLTGFNGTVIVNSPLTWENPSALGTNVNWVFATPQNVSANWQYQDNGGDGVAVDMYLGQLNGTANFTGGAGRRYGNLHIGVTNVDSLWTGNSRDSSANAFTAITKEGTGVLRMTGSYGHSGETTVNGGVMEVSNTGGPFNAPIPGLGIMTGTRAVRVNGGTFRLGTPGGGVLQGNAGTITTATTGLVLEANNGGMIDISNAYDGDAEVDGDNTAAFNSFMTAPGVTWAGAGGSVIGVVRHEVGTISPGRDGGAGNFGSLTFANTLKLFGGAVSVDVGSSPTASDRIIADTLLISGSTVIVNVVGNSIPAGGTYTFLHTNISGASTTQFGGLIVKGRGASGTFQQSSNQQEFMVKILTAATSDRITWNGGSGGTWDVRGGLNWLNSSNNGDYFYHGDTVTFTDNGAGTIQLAQNLAPGGEVRFNNNSTTYALIGPGKITGSASLRKTGTGTVKLLGLHDYTGGTTIDAGTLVLGLDNIYTGVGNGALQNANPRGQAGTGSIVNNGALVVAASDVTILKNNISGTGGVWFRDTGATRIDGTNTWLGGTTLSSGEIQLGHDNALPTNTVFNMVGFLDTGTGTNNFQAPRFDLRGHEQTILELNAFGVGTNNTIMSSDIGTTSIATLTIGRTGPGGWYGTIRQNKDNDHAAPCLVAVTKMSDGSEGGGIATINSSAIGLQNIRNYGYGGRTNINAGTYLYIGEHWPATTPGLALSSAHQFGTYTVAQGAALGGAYTIKTHVDVNPGGILAPGFAGAASANLCQQDFLNLNSGSLGTGSLTSQLDFGLYGFKSDSLAVLEDNGFVPTGISQVHLNAAAVEAGTFTLLDYSGAVIPDLLAKIQLNPSNITNPGTFTYTLVNNTQNTSLDLVVTQPIVTTTWKLDNNGSWGVGANWTTDPTTPNAFGSAANFGSISSPRTVTMDGPFNIGTANFTSGVGFTIVGAGNTTLSLGNLIVGSTVAINVTAGSHAINVPVLWDNDGTINVSGGAQLRIGGDFGLAANGSFSGHNVTKDGGGTLLVDSVRNTFGNDGSAKLWVKQGTVQMLHHTAPNANSSKVNSLAIDNGARLDLTNNSLVLDYGGLSGAGALLSQLRGWLKSTDARLFSSDADSLRGIGYKDNADSSGAGNAALGNFAGLTVDVTSILLRYTYLGDTNVDGQVDISDLYNLASNYDPKHTKGGSAIWQKGDFNYDGWVDLKDLTMLTTNWQTGVGNPLGSPLGQILASLGLPNVSVPEPATVGIMALGLTGLMARRRRRN
jgi:autotransporter-associated beta strand protein